MSQIAILEAFAELEDPRRHAGQRHTLQLEDDNLNSDSHPAIMLVSAYIVQRGLILEPFGVDAKTNEIKAIPELIKKLALNGVVFAFDAINTKKNVS